MTNLRTAAQQALEAIDWLRLHLQRDHQCLHMDPAQSGIPAWINKSEANLRAALAEPVQEPVTLPFVIEERAGVPVLYSNDGGCRPASNAEWLMWCAVRAHGIGGEA